MGPSTLRRLWPPNPLQLVAELPCVCATRPAVWRDVPSVFVEREDLERLSSCRELSAPRPPLPLRSDAANSESSPGPRQSTRVGQVEPRDAACGPPYAPAPRQPMQSFHPLTEPDTQSAPRRAPRWRRLNASAAAQTTRTQRFGAD